MIHWTKERKIFIIQRLADGETMAEISKSLGLCPGRIKALVLQWRNATGSKTTAHLVAYAFRKGYIK